MIRKIIDIVELRNQIKLGILRPYVERDKVYLEDAENGETIMVCDLKELRGEQE